MIFVFLVFSALVSNSLCRLVCETGWKLYRPDQSCLQFDKTESKYDDAKISCNVIRGNAYHVQITSARKDAFITEIMGADKAKDIWIGVRDSNNDGTLTSEDGRHPLGDYQPWLEDNTRPNSDPLADCGVRMFSESGGFWGNAICGERKSFICEKPAQNVAVGCEEGWHLNPSEDACIKAFRKQKPFWGARSFCQRRGGDLVTKMESRRQRVHAMGKRKTKGYYWIGVHSPSEDGEFVSVVDEKPVRDTPPFKTGPNIPDIENHCVALKGRKWFDVDCSMKLPFLCGKEPLVLP